MGNEPECQNAIPTNGRPSKRNHSVISRDFPKKGKSTIYLSGNRTFIYVERKIILIQKE